MKKRNQILSPTTTLMCAAAFVVDSAAGANVVRLGTLTIGPVVALYASASKKWLYALAPLCLWWAWWPVHFSVDNRGGRSATKQYFDPLLEALDKRQLESGVARVEVIPVLTHSEAWFVGAHTPMARG